MPAPDALFRLRRLHGAIGSRLGWALLCATVAGICMTALLCLLVNGSAFGRTEDEVDTQTAKSLATMLRAGRTVISKNQDRINDPNIGDKGIDGKMVLAEATAIYLQVTGAGPAAIDPSTLQGKLIRMQMDSIAEVMDTHQATINRQGVGFKGFIPAVFGRLVNEAFGRRAAGMADVKVTAPPHLIRNPIVQPDPWEMEVIGAKLESAAWPKDQPYSAMAPKNGRLAERILFPEYYGRSCLTCHGTPKGDIDITGFPKEGAAEGDLGGIISIALFR